MDVGVRELKRRLSEYLERASRGEVIRVTDRGKPKAVLAPIPGKLYLDEGLLEGWIQPPVDPAPPGRVQRSKSTQRSGSVLDEDRGS